MPWKRSAKGFLDEFLVGFSLTMDASRLCKLWQARCVATILEEQAVSTCIFGPLKSKYQPSLLANRAGDVPLDTCVGASSGALTTILM